MTRSASLTQAMAGLVAGLGVAAAGAARKLTGPGQRRDP